MLSVREILKLSSLENYGDVSYPWSEKYIFESKREDGSLFFDGEFSPNLVRRVIGESIPPRYDANRSKIERTRPKSSNSINHYNIQVSFRIITETKSFQVDLCFFLGRSNIELYPILDISCSNFFSPVHCHP